MNLHVLPQLADVAESLFADAFVQTASTVSASLMRSSGSIN